MGIKHIVDYGVIAILAVMSIIAVAIAIERFSFFRKVNITEYKTLEILELELTRHLHIIATIGSNAPYVGLLGTVLGIMFTFYVMGEGAGTNVNDIMTGLALALKATAAGLVTAIPAIILYNILHRKVNELLLLKEDELEREKLWFN